MAHRCTSRRDAAATMRIADRRCAIEASIHTTDAATRASVQRSMPTLQCTCCLAVRRVAQSRDYRRTASLGIRVIESAVCAVTFDRLGVRACPDHRAAKSGRAVSETEALHRLPLAARSKRLGALHSAYVSHASFARAVPWRSPAERDSVLDSAASSAYSVFVRIHFDHTIAGSHLRNQGRDSSGVRAIQDLSFRSRLMSLLCASFAPTTCCSMVFPSLSVKIRFRGIAVFALQ